MDFDEFSEMVKSIRNAEKCIGNVFYKEKTVSEEGSFTEDLSLLKILKLMKLFQMKMLDL